MMSQLVNKSMVLGLSLQLKHQIKEEQLHLTAINKTLQQGNSLVNKQSDVFVPHYYYVLAEG
jgi:hypothetical protein